MTRELRIRLLRPRSTTVVMSTEPLGAASDGSFVAPRTRVSATGETAGASWISLQPDAVRLRAGDEVRYRYTIQVPRSAQPGAHAFAVLAEQRAGVQGTNVDSSSGVAVTGSVGAVVVVTVPGALVSAAKVARASSPRWVWSGAPATFRVTVRNTGNTMITASGTLHSGTFSGVANRSSNAQPLVLLPDGRRTLRATWRDTPLMGWFKPVMIVDSGDAGRKRVAFPTIYILPPWWLITLAGFSVLLPLVVWLRRRPS